MRSLIVLALILGLAGCAPRVVGWSHVSGNPAQLPVHQMQCQTYAAQIAPYRAATLAPSNPLTSFLYGEQVAQFEAAFMACMQQLGYQPVYAQ